MSSKISALSAASALDGTETVPVVQSSTTKKATVSDFITRALAALKASAANAKDTTDASHFLTPANFLDVSAARLLFYKTGVNFNSTADQQLTKNGTFTSWRVALCKIENASKDITTAAGGIYSAASKGGYALVANTQTYTTSGAVFGANVGVNMTFTNSAHGLHTVTPYFSLTTAHGSAATADLYLYGYVVS